MIQCESPNSHAGLPQLSLSRILSQLKVQRAGRGKSIRAMAKSSRPSEIGDAHLFSPGSHAACISGVSKKGECPQFRAALMLNLQLCRGPGESMAETDEVGVVCT